MSLTVLTRLRALIGASSFLRFLISGGINTAVTYAVYLGLLGVLGYKIAYSIAYVVGIVLAFLINRLFVFQTHRGWRSMVLFPFVYLAQYLVSLAVLWAWVEHLHMSSKLAPLIAIVITIPLTFVLSRLVFGRGRGARFGPLPAQGAARHAETK
ncbi:MAG: GtrA family protein [Rhodanobacter sp.]